MNKKNLIFGTITLLVLAIVVSGCGTQTTPLPNNTQHTDADTLTENSARIQVNVVDKTTGEPVENAIVYLGGTGASGKCYSGSEGQCSIEGFVFGDYSLGVFKKGYDRYQESGHFEKGDNSFTVELEKKPETPDSFTTEGTVIKIMTAEGSRSENQYYKIRADDGTEEYLFDEIGINQGFEEYVNKRVSITGFKDTGFIGLEHEEAEGIYVESIE